MRQSRARRITLRITCVALVLTLAAWAYSHWRMDRVAYKFGSLVAPGAPHGEPDMWTFRARTLSFNSFGGCLFLGLSEYRSLAPTREELGNWNSYGGWDAFHLPRSSVKPDEHALTFYESPSEFSFVGLGIRSDMRQGEETRYITIPHWIPACAFAAAAAWLWLPIHRRSGRLKRGLCIHCGYDLATSPSTCPECGHAQGTLERSHTSTSAA